jgi:hypothetical protein
MSLISRINDFAGAVRDKLNLMMPRLLPSGGTTGQVLAKNADEDHEVEWIDPPAGGASTPTIPDFTDVSDIQPEVEVESDPVAVTGDADAVWPITVRGGALSIDGETWSRDASVVAGDAVRVKGVASADLLGVKPVTLHAPGLIKTWTITSAAELALTPADVAGLVGWFDASATETLTLSASNEVQRVGNRVAGMLDIVPTQWGGPQYEASNAVANGHPAIVWPNIGNNKGLWLEGGLETPCSEIFVVCAYFDGARNKFLDWITLLSDAAAVTGSGQTMCWGAKNSPGLLGNKDPNRVSKNGGAFTGTMLPLPLSVLRFSSTQASNPLTVSAFGATNSGSGSRAWNGPICEVVAYSDQVALNSTEIQGITEYLANKYDITLPA